MNVTNETTACISSVGADAGQSIKSSNYSISAPKSFCKENSDRPKIISLTDPKRFNAISMAELYDRVYESSPPIIDGLLYPGVYLLAGSAKIGKSFLMAQLGYHVSTGTPIWGLPVRKRKVLYLALEDSYSRLQKRLYQMFGEACSDSFDLTTSAGRVGEGLEDQITNYVQDNPGTGLIIVDTLILIRGDDDDKYSYAEDYDFVMGIKRLAMQHNICIILVHHTRKEVADDPFDMISGTKGLYAAADGAFVFTKDKRTSSNATLLVTGRDQADAKIDLVRDPERLSWELENMETELWKEPADPVLEAVAKVVAGDKPVWEGAPTELTNLIQMDIKPNALSMKLNVNSSRLADEYGVRYTNQRTHEGRRIRLELLPRDDACRS